MGDGDEGRVEDCEKGRNVNPPRSDKKGNLERYKEEKRETPMNIKSV